MTSVKRKIFVLRFGLALEGDIIEENDNTITIENGNIIRRLWRSLLVS